MSARRVEHIGDATLYLGDARDLLGEMKADLVLTDPAYGINAARDRKSEKWGWRDYAASGWDTERTPPEAVAMAVAAGRHAVVWGGNYFTDVLPPSSKWLIWDKCQAEFSLADVELAWCSFAGAARRINYPRAMALRDGKEHPTQKPLAVMEWTIRQAPSSSSVLDPFLGSGTTGIAALRLGRRFIGIEIEERYFDIACRRIEADARQPRLPLPEKTKPEAIPLPLDGPIARVLP